MLSYSTEVLFMASSIFTLKKRSDLPATDFRPSPPLYEILIFVLSSTLVSETIIYYSRSGLIVQEAVAGLKVPSTTVRYSLSRICSLTCTCKFVETSSTIEGGVGSMTEKVCFGLNKFFWFLMTQVTSKSPTMLSLMRT